MAVPTATLTSRAGLGMFALFAISACGGSERVGRTPAPPAPLPPPASTGAPTPAPAPAPSQTPARRSGQDDAEYRTNYLAAETVGAMWALEHGHDGQGVLVGVMDNGVLPAGELAGQVSPLSRDFGYDRSGGAGALRSGTGDSGSTHGTPVAAIIAARNDGAGVQGLAPGARIVSLRVDYIDADGTPGLGAGMTEAFAYAADHGIRIINRSIGKSRVGGTATELAAAVDAFGRSGGLVVQSTGNSGEADPTEIAEVTPGNRSAWLFVSALTQDGGQLKPAAYANLCGAAMARCVVAPGEVITHGVNGEITAFGGTSAAAPQASALAALILGKWPQLTGQQAGDIILATARDLGERGVDPVYGAGLIDVRAALEPINPVLATSTGTHAVTGATMMVNPAFGTAGLAAALSELVILDQYGRDYPADLSGLVRRPAFASPLPDLLQAANHTALFNGGGLAAAVAFSAGASGHSERRRADRVVAAQIGWELGSGLQFVASVTPGSRGALPDPGLDSGFAVHSFAPLADTQLRLLQHSGADRWSIAVHAAGDRHTLGLTGQWASRNASLALGLVQETGTVFGTPVGKGPLRFGNGVRSAFVAGVVRHEFAGWTLGARAALGASRLRLSDDLLLRESSLLWSGQVALDAQARIGDGDAWIAVAQPLTTVAGKGTVVAPAAFDHPGAMQFSQRAVALDGRVNPHLAFGYAWSDGRGVWRAQAGRAHATSELYALVSWSTSLEGS